jgi:hypothetical protein
VIRARRNESVLFTNDTSVPHTATTAREHRFGLVGYVVESKERTTNCLRLLRWLVGGAVAALAVLAVVLWLLLQLPTFAAVLGGMSGAAAGGAALQTWRKRKEGASRHGTGR